MKAAPPPPRRARVADAERRALGLRGGRAEGIDWSLEPWSGGPWASHLVGLAIRLCLSLGRCLPSMLDARERAVGNRRPARRGAAGALEDYRRRQGCSGATTAVAGAAAPPCGMGSSAYGLATSPPPRRCELSSASVIPLPRQHRCNQARRTAVARACRGETEEGATVMERNRVEVVPSF